MKKLPHFRVRLWILMSASFAGIMLLITIAIVHNITWEMADAYKKEMAHLLTAGLERLEAEHFSESALENLSKQGIYILLLDAETGESRFVTGGPLPMVEDEQLGALNIEQPGDAAGEYLYFRALVRKHVGDGDGSFLATDIDLANQPGVTAWNVRSCSSSAGKKTCSFAWIFL